MSDTTEQAMVCVGATTTGLWEPEEPSWVKSQRDFHWAQDNMASLWRLHHKREYIAVKQAAILAVGSFEECRAPLRDVPDVLYMLLEDPDEIRL